MKRLPQFEELADLVWSLANDRLEETGAARLRELLSQDRGYVRAYLKLIDQFAALEWERGEGAAHDRRGECDQLPPLSLEGQPSLPIVLDLSPPRPTPRPFYLGTTAFCYAVSTVVILVGLVVAQFSMVPLGHPVASQSPRQSPSASADPLPTFVAQVTGMVDCQLLGSGKRLAEGSHLALGQALELQSGLLEITYANGVKVILAGRTRYQIDTRDSGYLSLGKLAARVETKPDNGRKHPQDSRTAPGEASDSKAPLFAVRTPTSIVTDLGTEFGVEVDESGASEAQVFQGRIEVRSTQTHKDSTVRTVTLQKDQSARIAANPAAPIVVGNAVASDRFVRRLPKRIRLNLFNTGVGIKEGDNDQRWKVVARTDDPKFTPRPAIAYSVPVHHLPGDPPGVGHLYMLPNDPDRSQWISLFRDGDQPGGVTFTFRTTFELRDVLPDTAVLRGRFIVDDHIREIRLNGQKLVVPPHDWSWIFLSWSYFQATGVFVDGTNVLEIDVYNGRESGSTYDDRSGMSLRVELEGTAMPRVTSTPSAVDTAVKKEGEDKPSQQEKTKR